MKKDGLSQTVKLLNYLVMVRYRNLSENLKLTRQRNEDLKMTRKVLTFSQLCRLLLFVTQPSRKVTGAKRKSKCIKTSTCEDHHARILTQSKR